MLNNFRVIYLFFSVLFLCVTVDLKNNNLKKNEKLLQMVSLNFE